MRNSPRIWLHLVIIAILIVVGLYIVKERLGTAFFEKTLQTLIAPVGVIWLGLFLISYCSRLYRAGFVAWLSMFLFVVLSVCGNSYLSNSAMSRVERNFSKVEIDQLEEMDAVVVLGGGTSLSKEGQFQLGPSGDRLALAARIYHAGKAKLIICTGEKSLNKDNGDPTPGEVASQIFAQWNIPEEHIKIVGGPNTSQEMSALESFLEERELENVGLVTSAWHMPRALRLAKDHDLNFTPLPADFKSRKPEPNPGWVIPSANSLSHSQIVLKEWLAQFVNR